MDLSNLTPEAFKLLTPEQRRDVAAAFAQLPYERQAEILERSFRPEFHSTERQRQQSAAAWQLADPGSWRQIAASTVGHVVESYRQGHLDMRGALEAVTAVAVGCWLPDRIRLLGEASTLLLRAEVPTRGRGRRAPPWPLWLRNATANLVLHQHELAPGERRSPKHPDDVKVASDQTSVPIENALAILNALGWFATSGTPKASTVDDWVRARVKSRNTPSAT